MLKSLPYQNHICSNVPVPLTQYFLDMKLKINFVIQGHNLPFQVICLLKLIAVKQNKHFKMHEREQM